MSIRIVSSVVSPSIRIAETSEWDRAVYFVRRPVDVDNTAVFQVHPDLVGIGKVDGFFGTGGKSSLVDHLACLQIHNDERVIVLTRNKQTLTFDVYRDAVHVAFGRQWNCLD